MKREGMIILKRMKAIACVDMNWAIGKDNKLLFRILNSGDAFGKVNFVEIGARAEGEVLDLLYVLAELDGFEPLVFEERPRADALEHLRVLS